MKIAKVDFGVTVGLCRARGVRAQDVCRTHKVVEVEEQFLLSFSGMWLRPEFGNNQWEENSEQHKPVIGFQLPVFLQSQIDGRSINPSRDHNSSKPLAHSGHCLVIKHFLRWLLGVVDGIFIFILVVVVILRLAFDFILGLRDEIE